MQTAPAQDDALIDLLNNRSYDRDALIRDLNPPPVTLSLPPTDKNDTPAAESSGDSNAEPAFAPIQSELPLGQQQNPIQSLALVLPTNAAGNTAIIATLFRQGCINGLSALSASLRLDTYAHDGSSAQTINAYESAIRDGAEFIIGPMQKHNVLALQKRYPQAPLPTLLLQPSGSNTTTAAGYYVLTLDIGEEAAELAKQISTQTSRVMVISDASQLSQRQRSAFSKAWGEITARQPEYVYIYDAASDWQKLFNRLKDLSEEAEENSELDTQPPLIIFSAGNGDFTRRARNFVPQGYPIYASSVFFSGGSDMNFLDNLYIMEMPWFVGDSSNDDAAVAAAADIRTRSALQQRFYALGLDACRLVAQTPLWFNGWQMEGASGELQLVANHFRRRGILSRYQNGVLSPLSRP